ncbi:ABC transporter permease, partial [Bowmanella denitrificans]|uniref:ABC transporter permease n=1 Tax=Bowmanella denitrificans TaxID=366582 RepID=UPI0031D1CECB
GFAGLAANPPMQSAILTVDGRPQALEFYLAEVLSSQWPVTASYEEVSRLVLQEENNRRELWVSFFSGGYQQLGLQPVLGDFSAMEFPLPGAELVAAISYPFWQRHFQGRRDIIGQQLRISDKAVRIVAVMPQNFKAFRPHQQVDLVLPFSQQQHLRLIKQGSVSPSTLSYLMGAPQALAQVADSATAYLQEQAYLLDDSSVSLSPALGVENATYLAVSQRINLLTLLFMLLLLFCVFAFLAFMAGESARKQQELQVRRLCGASSQQINLQLLLETSLLLVLLLALFTLLLAPLGQLVAVFLPQLHSEQLLSVGRLFSTWLGAALLLAIGVLFALLWLQQKWLKTHTGRGQSQGLGQKLQSYLLLSLLISLSTVVLYFSLNLVLQQWRLYQQPLGFSTEGRYLVSFEIRYLTGP